MKRNRSPALLNALLGLWLFVSAFVWPHTTVQMTNTWIVGVLFIVFGIGSIAHPTARFGTTVFSMWLLISACTIRDTSPATAWNNGLAALAALGISLIPTSPAPPLRPRPV